MSTYTERKSGLDKPSVRVDLEDLLKTKVSMLGSGMLPAGYGNFEDADDVRNSIQKVEDKRIARLTIVWDCPVDDLELEGVLDQMRAFGAAMVTSVEEVKS